MLDHKVETDQHKEDARAIMVDLHHSIRGDQGCSESQQHRTSLAQALDNSSNYFFDMSDRWRDAFLDSLQDPIYPASEEVDLLHELQKVDLLRGIQNMLLGAS
ncbi:unnamed protein product [Cylindrotheca closterium]|uniref:Uncharacterized protein n=1 Tax=Cylindrotheca closterium TaxID=2856 RepID=A0AAD2FTP1_9STRA|nr:unnamed protein product [Cylindrotheca closterium]